LKDPWKNRDYYVSHYNYAHNVRRNFHLPKSVEIHDITLRDGEQQAGIVFRKDEKIQIANLLAEIGVQRIEAGLPAVSSQDEEAVREIAHLRLGPKIFSFSRCMRNDVDTARKCDVDGVVMEIPSSSHILKYAYGWLDQKAIDLSIDATDYAHKYGLEVVFFTIDSTRATFANFWTLVNSVAKSGHMDSLVLVDTFGVCSPQAIGHFVDLVKRKKINKPLEIHCHNDFGLAVANTVAAVTHGINVVHTTVNGIGERMGNASLGEVALALEYLYGVKTGLDLTKLTKISQMVSKLSKVPVPPNYPAVGQGAFKIESGIIAGWWSKVEPRGMVTEIFPYRPECVGNDPIEVVLGKKSGRDSIIYMLRKLNLKAGDDSQIDRILLAVKEKSLETKRNITLEEFEEILSNLHMNPTKASTLSQ
jgi:isopropylmalate/homocitrate/citramalate synthase